ncbi:hypothetical protein Tco_1151417, partial [Tanacetum coccineum]
RHLSHTKGETKELKRVIPISITQPTQAQPITTIITHPKSSQAAPRSDKGKWSATESDEDPLKRLVPASTIVRPDPDEEVKVPLMINGKMYYLTDKEMQAYLDKEEKIRKAAKEERLFAISKPEVIKVVQEEAENIGLDPKKIASAKAGEKKYKFESYMWTINNRLKLETITDIKIHPKTKPVVITVYRGTDDRNFDVNKPFAFGAFGIFELDELREIIPKKKNTVVQDLMNSLNQRMKALVSYLVAASMVQLHENARFNMKLKKLIDEHPDLEKLKSKKVKLEALRYEMN